jgi:hypothetical protein
MRYTQVPADFDLQLFAAEPDVVKPIYLAWDERGRAWVVEARDYPHGLVAEGELGKTDIKICEDTDGDGRADKFTVFAEGLNLATSLVFVNGGVLVSEARHMLFLKDTDGDDRRRMSGSPSCPAGARAIRTPCRATSAAVSTTGSMARSATRTSAATVGGKDLQFGQGVFRFKADGSALEFLHQFNNNTWGFGINAYGDVFGSTANGHPDLLRLPARPHSESDAAGIWTTWGGGGGGGGAADFVPATGSMTSRARRPGERSAVAVRQVAGSRYADASEHAERPHGGQLRRLHGGGGTRVHGQRRTARAPARQGAGDGADAKLIGIMDIQPDGGGYKAPTAAICWRAPTNGCRRSSPMSARTGRCG